MSETEAKKAPAKRRRTVLRNVTFEAMRVARVRAILLGSDGDLPPTGHNGGPELEAPALDPVLFHDMIEGETDGFTLLEEACEIIHQRQLMIARILRDTDALNEQIDANRQRAERFEMGIARILEAVHPLLSEMTPPEANPFFEGALGTIHQVQRNERKLEVIDVALTPPRFLVPQPKKPDAAALKAYLLEGEQKKGFRGLPSHKLGAPPAPKLQWKRK